ncbi:hypothetical protein [Kocuria sp. HSID16901]|uniref:hypothetical protein n=1 Tax=Kocuria sp. HSID16901 TaxID=2419505 RepID=UPI00066085D3|nr:hypothetical protein [Kocuria sp. HSID16901]RUQ20907.1 hypothetical protein D8M21_08380 [Kocuria sp. HSID16901]
MSKKQGKHVEEDFESNSQLEMGGTGSRVRDYFRNNSAMWEDFSGWMAGAAWRRLLVGVVAIVVSIFWVFVTIAIAGALHQDGDSHRGQYDPVSSMVVIQIPAGSF